MNDTNTDQMVLELLKKVEEKKEQIGNAERPVWLTNCTFGYNPDTNVRINLQVVRDIETLVDIHAFLTCKQNCFKQSVKFLKLNEKEVKFQYMGFTYDQWVADIETRVNGLQIKAKRDELAKLEARVNALVSPEQRRKIELEKLVKELN